MKTRLLIIIVALLSVAVLLFGVMYDLTYIDDREFRTDSMNPKISSFEENTYVVWAEAKDSEFFDVYLRKITNGNLLDKSINMTQGKSFYPIPQVLASENNVYVLWQDRVNGHVADEGSTYFKKSNDYGQTFDDDVTVLGSSDIDIISHTPIDMIESDGVLYVFMFKWDPQTDEKTIIFRASTDNGDTFGNPIPFFQFDKKWAILFDAVSVNGITYAVSADEHGYSDETGRIDFRKIYSDGTVGETVSLNKAGKFVTFLNISVPEKEENENNVYVVSREISDERNLDSGLVMEKPSLFFTKSRDGGATFEEPIKINTKPNFGGVDTQSIQANSYDNHLDIMWNEEYFDGQNSSHKTLYAKSDDNGDTFDIAIHPLDELRSKYGKVYSHERDGTLYFIIVSKNQSFFEGGTMYLAKSDDGGTRISKVVNVVRNPLTLANEPRISINGDDIQIIADVTHDKNCILHISSEDNGESFAEPANLSPNGYLEDCFVK